MNHAIAGNLSVPKYAEKMISTTKQKLKEVRQIWPDKPVYLIGWGPGAIVACTVSLTECVSGVIALGFPLLGIAGRRGEPNDPLFRMRVPTLFVIGGKANNNV